MAYRRLIIDGYSLLHRIPDLADRAGTNLTAARQRLIQLVERVAHALGEQVTIVFDGKNDGGVSPLESTSVEVVFSPPDQTADTVIERLVHEDKKPAGVLVVTSDRGERETVTAAGADAMSCDQFLDLCRLEERELLRAAKKLATPRRGATLGDFFPPGDRTAN